METVRRDLLPVLHRLIAGEDLSEAEAYGAMEAVAEGDVSEARLAAFVTALEVKGVSGEELVGFAKSLRPRAIRVECPEGAIDTCGTGGDRLGTFNISTAAAFVAAGCGAVVAKHGNRSASGRCGSADVLAALGVPTDLDAAAASARLRRDGFAFLFAPNFHPAIARATPVRKALGFRTVFNLLGPIVNPAFVTRQVVGVPAARYVEPVARALALLGAERALVVHGGGGLDELSTWGRNVIAEVENGRVTLGGLDARDLGLTAHPPEAIRGGEAAESAGLLIEALSGRDRPRGEVTVLNAAAALLVAGKVGSFQQGLALARQAIASGAALAALERARGGG